jgi:hypothetical protein
MYIEYTCGCFFFYVAACNIHQRRYFALENKPGEPLFPLNSNHTIGNFRPFHCHALPQFFQQLNAYKTKQGEEINSLKIE